MNEYLVILNMAISRNVFKSTCFNVHTTWKTLFLLTYLCVSSVSQFIFPPACILFLCDTSGLFPARPRYSSTDADTFPHLLYQTLLPGRLRVNWCSIFLHLFPCLSNEGVYICRNVPFPRISTPARPHRCAHSHTMTPLYSFSSSVTQRDFTRNTAEHGHTRAPQGSAPRHLFVRTFTSCAAYNYSNHDFLTFPQISL